MTGAETPRRSRGAWVVAGLAAALAASIAAAACVGPSVLGPSDALRLARGAMAGRTPEGADASAAAILLAVRLPRVLLAAAVGASLALAGVAMQALFRNPLASPYVLGVSSGASFGAALAMLAGGAALASRAGVPLSAAGAGIGTILLVYGLARALGGSLTHTLLLVGMAVSSLFSALVSLLLYLSGEWLREILFWLMGGFWKASWADVAVVGLSAGAGAVFLRAMERPMDLLALGERGAGDLGLDVRRAREILLAGGSLLASLAVASSGAIGFVGLVVPHLARSAVGPAHRRLTPVSALGGALLLVWADTFARTVREPVEIPVGVLTAVLGVPFFLLLLARGRKGGTRP
ncbi:MAG: iron ABC transporter permease [Planctomycetes bacterium]|nr:iron ABC transporter permease [Planctomycetota bacterium]